MSAIDIVLPVVWPVMPTVRAVYTTRLGGVSSGGFARLNLGDHVGDAPDSVAENRRRVTHALNAKPHYLRQVHGTHVANLDDDKTRGNTIADACMVSKPGIACVVMVADCLPVLIANAQGTVVAAAHCGWRGLSGVSSGGVGVLETTMIAARAKSATLRSNKRTRADWQDSDNQRDEWVAWLGPAIGPKYFEVGQDVYDAFVRTTPSDSRAFEPLPQTPGRPPKYLANIFVLARMRLARMGVSLILGGGDCTYAQPEKYFSHRRSTHQSAASGRQAALIWIDAY
jgi:polyphenol oxidase